MPGKNPRRRPAAAPERFFERYLKGEEAPSLSAMRGLYGAATEFHSARVWERLGESDLVATPGEAGELCYCSVALVRGEIPIVNAFRGAEGYWFYRRAAEGSLASDEGCELSTIYVQWRPLREVEKADRTALAAVDRTRGAPAPVVRTIRPGYLPWFPTEGEVRLLTRALRAMLAVDRRRAELPLESYWKGGDKYPLVDANGTFDGQGAPAPAPPPQRDLQPAPLDLKRIQKIRSAQLPSEGTLEVHDFWFPTQVGKRDERKACVRLALAADAETGLTYPPRVATIEVSPAETLPGVVLSAIESRRAVPAVVRVANADFKRLLRPLAKALAFSVKICRPLAALEEVRDGMLRMMRLG